MGKQIKTYRHDYTKPQQADQLLREALVKIKWDNYWEARLRIEEARKLLLDYLAHDNMKEVDDAADGWVRRSDLNESTDRNNNNAITQ